MGTLKSRVRVLENRKLLDNSKRMRYVLIMGADTPIPAEAAELEAQGWEVTVVRFVRRESEGGYNANTTRV